MRDEARVSTIGDVALRYRERGTGLPILILHGAGVDHREMAIALEPLFEVRSGYRRIHVDLPGMGETPAPEALDSNDAVLDLLLGLADDVAGDGELLVVGHSYDGYLARAIANRYAARVAGLALICPATDRSIDVPVMASDSELFDVARAVYNLLLRTYLPEHVAAERTTHEAYVAVSTGMTRLALFEPANRLESALIRR